MDELEASLLASWDRETLLVYADALQAAGDPRGELIALDLEVAERGVTPELARRRRKALYDWLGGSTIRDRPIHETSFRYGFATDFFATEGPRCSAMDYLIALFTSPAGPYVRGVTIAVTDGEALDDVLAQVAGQQRRWLERLEVRVQTTAIVSERRVNAVIAATPRLHTFAVFGAQSLRAFAHPNVRQVTTDPYRFGLVQTVPHVETLDLLLDEGVHEDDGPDLYEHTVSSIASLRGLRHLDLSRNEPIYVQPPQADDEPPPRSQIDAYALGASLAVEGLQTLRMPSLQSRQQVAMLRTVLDRAPSLEVTVARTYRIHAPVFARFDHPRVQLRAPFIWPPECTLSPREALTVTVPTEEHGEDVSLTSLIRLLEAQWDDLPPNSRTAWIELWDFLADLPWEDAEGRDVTKPFPAQTLLTALEALDDVIPSSGTVGHWAQLAEKLRAAELPPDATASIRRYWGW